MGRGGALSHPAVETLLPHRGHALLVEEVVETTAGAVICRGRVPASHPAASQGRVGAWMAVELAAQAAGVLQGLAAGVDSPPRKGYLVRVRDAVFARSHLTVEAALTVRVELEAAGGAMARFRARVEQEGKGVATASLATYLP